MPRRRRHYHAAGARGSVLMAAPSEACRVLMGRVVIFSHLKGICVSLRNRQHRQTTTDSRQQVFGRYAPRG